jgi:hypothetical protein
MNLQANFCVFNLSVKVEEGAHTKVRKKIQFAWRALSVRGPENVRLPWENITVLNAVPLILYK